MVITCQKVMLHFLDFSFIFTEYYELFFFCEKCASTPAASIVRCAHAVQKNAFSRELLITRSKEKRTWTNESVIGFSFSKFSVIRRALQLLRTQTVFRFTRFFALFS